jgi:hypothetical protein
MKQDTGKHSKDCLRDISVDPGRMMNQAAEV